MKFKINDLIFVKNKQVLEANGARPEGNIFLGKVINNNNIYNIHWFGDSNRNMGNDWFYLSSTVENYCIKVSELNKIVQVLYGK